MYHQPRLHGAFVELVTLLSIYNIFIYFRFCSSTYPVLFENH